MFFNINKILCLYVQYTEYNVFQDDMAFYKMVMVIICH